MPTITRWLDKFEQAGGITLPDILTLYSSDGLKSRELLKANDDLRQDAVLEQVNIFSSFVDSKFLFYFAYTYKIKSMYLFEFFKYSFF